MVLVSQREVQHAGRAAPAAGGVRRETRRVPRSPAHRARDRLPTGQRVGPGEPAAAKIGEASPEKQIPCAEQRRLAGVLRADDPNDERTRAARDEA